MVIEILLFTGVSYYTTLGDPYNKLFGWVHNKRKSVYWLIYEHPIVKLLNM